MPSHFEVWGLVLNEALASGLFCLSSKYAGATEDLIDDGINGISFDPNNESNFVETINKALITRIVKIKESFQINCENEALKQYSLIRSLIND